MASMRPPQPQAIAKVSISALVISLPIIYMSLLRVPPSALARDSTFWFLMSHSIIAIIAADSGVLFFSPASHHQYDDDHDNLPDVVVRCDQPVATVQGDYCDATSVLLMAPHESTAPVDISTSVVAGGGDQPSWTGTEEEGHALALTKGEGAASTPKTDTDHTSVLDKRDEEEEEAPEPASTNKSDATMAEGDQWATPQAHITVTPDDQDEDSVEKMKLRCSATEETDKVPPSEEEREYWQLSDEELNRKVEEFITRFNRDMLEQEAAVC
ncbi:unnamed protein product [Triticum turgidum subsp. durum]|uniref:DUF4408 domain-containing protein n=1 Tax=Triticum turgidum subsp. durum TaxID=4567 RepID=A0A9R0TWR8_TRITD|nr:unnamed protein product [Triticum turgidum subsp. durum]